MIGDPWSVNGDRCSLGFRQKLDFKVSGVGGKLGRQGATGHGLFENQLSHDKARLGEQLRVAEPDDAVP